MKLENPTVNIVVRELLVKRISEVKSESGLTMAEISRRLDRNPAYLQQFIARGTPTELDDGDRYKLAELLQLDPEQLKGPGRVRKWKRSFDWRPQSDDFAKVSHHAQSAPLYNFRSKDEATSRLVEFLLQALSEANSSSPVVELLQNLNESKKQFSPVDSWRAAHKGYLPVYRLVEEGNGLRISVQARTLLPKEVSSNFGARTYGVSIVGDSMAPELRNGAIAIVDPDLPYRPNTTCVFRERNMNEGGGGVLVRRLHEVSDEGFKVYSYEHFASALHKLEHGAKASKPEASLKLETLSRKSYPNCHVIVGVLSPPVT